MAYRSLREFLAKLEAAGELVRVTEDEFRGLALAVPDAVEGVNMGSTYFKANGKDLARLLGGGEGLCSAAFPQELAGVGHSVVHEAWG